MNIYMNYKELLAVEVLNLSEHDLYSTDQKTLDAEPSLREFCAEISTPRSFDFLDDHPLLPPTNAFEQMIFDSKLLEPSLQLTSQNFRIIDYLVRSTYRFWKEQRRHIEYLGSFFKSYLREHACRYPQFPALDYSNFPCEPRPLISLSYPPEALHSLDSLRFDYFNKYSKSDEDDDDLVAEFEKDYVNCFSDIDYNYWLKHCQQGKLKFTQIFGESVLNSIIMSLHCWSSICFKNMMSSTNLKSDIIGTRKIQSKTRQFGIYAPSFYKYDRRNRIRLRAAKNATAPTDVLVKQPLRDRSPVRKPLSSRELERTMEPIIISLIDEIKEEDLSVQK